MVWSSYQAKSTTGPKICEGCGFIWKAKLPLHFHQRRKSTTFLSELPGLAFGCDFCSPIQQYRGAAWLELLSWVCFFSPVAYFILSTFSLLHLCLYEFVTTHRQLSVHLTHKSRLLLLATWFAYIMRLFTNVMVPLGILSPNMQLCHTDSYTLIPLLISYENENNLSVHPHAYRAQTYLCVTHACKYRNMNTHIHWKEYELKLLASFYSFFLH